MITTIIASGWFCHAVDLSKPSRLALLLSSCLCLLGSYAVATPILNHQPFLSILDTRSNPQSITTTTIFSETTTANNLILKAHLTESLDVPNEIIDWQVKDAQGVQVQHLHGQEQSLRLTEGSYQVQLTIGRFTATKQLVIKAGVVSTPYFKANIGRLVVTANHAADWLITSLSDAGICVEIKATQQLEEWVSAGFYEITPTHSGVARRQVVNVLAGDISTVNIDIPVVQVSLIAVENNQPFFKPVEWSVFRLEQGERQHVGNYYHHSQGITVPTGYYEVIATHDSTVRSRQFWVKENTTNKVVLAMD